MEHTIPTTSCGQNRLFTQYLVAKCHYFHINQELFKLRVVWLGFCRQLELSCQGSNQFQLKKCGSFSCHCHIISGRHGRKIACYYVQAEIKNGILAIQGDS